MAPHVKQTGGIQDSAMLLRGVDSFGNFIAEKPPASDMDAEAMAFHSQVLENLAKVKFAGTDHNYKDAV